MRYRQKASGIALIPLFTILVLIPLFCAVKRGGRGRLPEIFEEEPGMNWKWRWRQKEEQEGGEECRELSIYFAFDDYRISGESGGRLADFIKRCWKEGGGYRILVEGHCDERGGTAYNLALGQKRADEIKRYLKELRVEAAEIETVSYGEEAPVVEGHSEEAWAMNRRGVVNIFRRTAKMEGG